MSALRKAKDLFKIAPIASQLQKETGQTCPGIQNQDGESGKPLTDDMDIICYQQAAYSLAHPSKITSVPKQPSSSRSQTTSRIKSRFLSSKCVHLQ